jgi:uncharacterized protein YecE (DUF72 family)
MPNALTGCTNEERRAKVTLGTSSWTFDGWRGPFYPANLARNDWLAFYARHFAGVEVNTSFYGLPAPAVLIRWVESVPPGFTFALKFPKRITHEATLRDCEADTTAFLDVLAALGPAAGPALLQLPPTLSRSSHGAVLARYVDGLATQLARQPGTRGQRVAVEVRADDLMTEAFARFLDERGLTLALVDRAGTPDLYDLWQGAGHRAGFAFVRWIGDDRAGPSGDAAVVSPQDAKLEQWAGRLATLVRAGVDVYGFMHNPYEGHAPASVHRLVAALAQVEVTVAWAPAQAPVEATAFEPQLRLL